MIFRTKSSLAASRGFTDVVLMVDMAMVLGLAVLLGAVIAYHPATRRKAASLEELEQLLDRKRAEIRKILKDYGVVLLDKDGKVDAK